MAAAAGTRDEMTPIGAAFARLRADPLLAAALGFWCVTVVAYFVPLPDTLYTEFEVSIAEIGLVILSVLLFVNAAFKAASDSARLFWALLAAHFGFWLVARFSNISSVGTDAWTPGIVADVFYLGAYACIIVAVELRLEMRDDPLWLLNFGTSAAAGLLLLIAIASYVALVPFAVGTTGYQSYFFLYASVDAYLAGRLMVAAIKSGQESWSRAYWMLALTWSLITVADILSWMYRIEYLDFHRDNTLNLIWNLWCPAAFISSRVGLDTYKLATPLIERIYPAANVLVIFGLLPPAIHLAGYGFGQFDPDLQNARIAFVFFWVMLIGAILIAFHWIMRKKIVELSRKRSFAEGRAENLERQLERSLTMGTLGRLSAGLAHDFGNSISAIGMHSKLIADQADIGDIDRSDIDGVNRGVRYAQELVDKLRVFSSTREQTSAAPLDIVAEARSTVLLAQPSLKQGLQLELDIGQPSAFAVATKGDAHRVLINFLYNANDAISEIGTIKVSVREESVHAECASCALRFSGRYVVLAVSDNGRGVDPAIADNLFEPLITSKAGGQGGGLGLSTVHGIVHRLGGHVGLAAYGSGGSCFSAYFVAADDGNSGS